MEKALIKKVVLYIELGIVALVLLFAAFNCFYTVSEQQQAIILQFGKAIDTQKAGLHFKIPFIQQVELVDMTVRGMEFGYTSANGNYTSIESESLMITNDFNFVSVDFYIEWNVSVPEKFLFNSASPESTLRNILQSEARSVVSSYTVDEVLTTAKGMIQSKVKEGVIAKLASYDIGVMITNISIQDTVPPTAEVVSAFKNVENAKQNKDTDINRAKTYKNEIIPKANAEADRIIKEAEAIRESRLNEATGQVARFNEMYGEYIRNKDITRKRMYLEAMEEILPGVKVIVESTDDSGLLKLIDLTNGGSNAGEEGADSNYGN